MQNARGLHEALAGDERLLEDARAEREARRTERGYVSPADARAFLALARTAPERPGEDPITRAHFRELKPLAAAGPSPRAAAGLPRPPSLRQLLLEAGVEAGAHVEAPAPPAKGALFRQTLAELLERDPEAHQRVIEELAYLSNVLVSGDTSVARRWRPAEAAEQVLELCDEGLRSIADRGGSDPGAVREALVRWGAVGAFRFAWASRGGSG